MTTPADSSPPPQPLAYDPAAYLYARDLNHLNLLGLFHYVYGALTMLFSSIFIIHIVMGIMMVNAAMGRGQGRAQDPPPAFGWLFIGLGSGAVLIGWSLGILAIFSGHFLRHRRHWMFSIVIAAIACLWVALGTVLGVFTLVVLMRESVQALYGRGPRLYFPGPAAG